MKIQCDVCAVEQATVFCTADEAALCEGCDRMVHHVNKLAQKHRRFSLLHPPGKEAPLCDICQEARAYLFCKEDRAILCRGCDLSIHQANELTQNHNRYILTGVKLSTNPSVYQFSSSPSSSADREDLKHKAKSSKSAARSRATTNSDQVLQRSESSSMSNNSTGNISEYLETLPGWHVEDYFDPSPNNYAFC
uniref:B box-type domain-containing protein n=1 Tax=Kalanchoe fedtschenkoi TaxID=63787 RepID=A0A7N0T0Y6_KALFE